MPANGKGASSFNEALAQLFFPQRYCLLCNALTGKPGLCEACEVERGALERCDICAAFLPARGRCAHCAAQRPSFAQARAAWPYSGNMRKCLRYFKYKEQTWLRRPLARLMLQTYEEHYAHIHFDAVIAAPLSPHRLKERGYNQSELLSQLIAVNLRLPQRPELLKRVLDTPPLATYNGPQRRALLKQAFVAGSPLPGCRLLVVDDIYTSGATLDACAAVLLAAGVSEVYGLMAAGIDEREKAGIFL